MRIGLDLRTVTDPAERHRLATEADRLGLWAVLVGGEPGTECTTAAALAVDTVDIHLAVVIDGRAEHVLTIAEEIAVLDQLSARRAHPVVDGPADRLERIERLLAGHIVDGVALTPPPAQSQVRVQPLTELVAVELSGDPERDASVIDGHRGGGVTHLFVGWPADSLLPLARHLVTRAAAPDFPAVVAEWADRVDPAGR